MLLVFLYLLSNTRIKDDGLLTEAHFREAIGKGLAPVDLKLPTRGLEAAYARTKYKDAFAPMVTQMDMQQYRSEATQVVQQALLEFTRQSGADHSETKAAFETLKITPNHLIPRGFRGR